MSKKNTTKPPAAQSSPLAVPERPETSGSLSPGGLTGTSGDASSVASPQVSEVQPLPAMDTEVDPMEQVEFHILAGTAEVLVIKACSPPKVHVIDPRVTFVGNSASVWVNENGDDRQFANLSFSAAGVCLYGDGGWINADNLADLREFIRHLPEDIDTLDHLVDELRQSGESVSRGAYTATIEQAPPTKLGKITVANATSNAVIQIYREPDGGTKLFFQTMVKRFVVIEPVLEQAEFVGRHIERRPYKEIIHEIAKTGLPRIERYGFGYYTKGTLKFRPDRAAFLVRQLDNPASFELQRLDGPELDDWVPLDES